jgi:hypothetical protein
MYIFKLPNKKNEMREFNQYKNRHSNKRTEVWFIKQIIEQKSLNILKYIVTIILKVKGLNSPKKSQGIQTKLKNIKGDGLIWCI